eukprot:CAMPEP_0117554682 /NCGR_PEP_ID=MMETSP0784-20121206/50882_1 /TAXON_ID=39447 /ORGANISM="" /LENGTH=137 /DNA_ID=CAMNT_0005351859 /DNA_START=180 /DNA_END=593 /DNA_ORIENTATION=+
MSFMLILLGAAAKLAGQNLAQVPVAVPKEQVRGLIRTTGHLLNAAFDFARRVVVWEEQSDTLKVLACCYILSLVQGLLSIVAVLFLIGNLLFVVPGTMMKQKTFIDANIQPVLKKVLAKKDELIALVPTYDQVYNAE